MRKTRQEKEFYEEFCQLPEAEQAALADLIRGLAAAKKGGKPEIIVWQDFLETIKRVAPERTAFVESMIVKTLSRENSFSRESVFTRGGVTKHSAPENDSPGRCLFFDFLRENYFFTKSN